MRNDHDDHDLLSEAGRSRRDGMLPLMQEAMREASRKRRQRRSVVASLVLLVAAITGWELLDISITRTRTPEIEVVDSTSTTPPPEAPITPTACNTPSSNNRTTAHLDDIFGCR